MTLNCHAAAKKIVEARRQEAETKKNAALSQEQATELAETKQLLDSSHVKLATLLQAYEQDTTKLRRELDRRQDKKDAELAAKDAELAAKDAEIAATKQRSSQLEQRIRELEIDARDSRELNDQLEASLTFSDAQISEKDAQIAAAEQEKQQAEAQMSQYVRTIIDLEGAQRMLCAQHIQNERLIAIVEQKLLAVEQPPDADTAAAGEGSHAADDDATMCSVCMQETKTEICVPCGHKCLCKTCAEEVERRAELRGEQPRCPICRDETQYTITVWE
jgi:chromosome segregation ATPase